MLKKLKFVVAVALQLLQPTPQKEQSSNWKIEALEDEPSWLYFSI